VLKIASNNTQASSNDTKYEQLYSSASGREKKQTKTIYNKHQNTIDMQDYKAVTCVAYKINCK